jgi:pimeloyl-ACP methyl ester carboxylesterase
MLGATWTSASRICRAAASGTAAASAELTCHELSLEAPNARRWRRALVLAPADGPQPRPQAALVLLHGRGEAGDERAAMEAWRMRYGLADSYARLRRPPLELPPGQKFMRTEQLDALNARLLAHPFAGVVSICPVTPNPGASKDPQGLLDEYAEWIEKILLPAARAVAALGPECPIGIDGCSMGGFVAAEVFVRKPHLFRTFGVVQPAVGQFRLSRYARALAAARGGLSGIHLLSSSNDPYREVTQAWSRELERLGARPSLEVLPGPHDQSWLRAAGTPCMLEWHDRHLRIPLAGRVL